MRVPTRQTTGYIAVLVLCFMVAVVAGWTDLGAQIDNDAYDFMMRHMPAQGGAADSIILGVDETTLTEMGGMRAIRTILAEGLEALAETTARAVAVDFILADYTDPAEDKRLAQAFAGLPNLVLASDIVPGENRWENPIPEFRAAADAVGHVHADPDVYDNVTRRVALEKAAGRDRRWALALEAFRLWRGGGAITESPDDVEVGGLRIPAPRSREEARPLLVRYRQEPVPTVSVRQLVDNPGHAALFRDKVVFVGVTAQSAADARHNTPFSGGQPMAGVAIHAAAFETLASGDFLTPASNTSVVLFCILLATAAGITYAYRSGWQAYLIGGVLLLAAHGLPVALFWNGTVFPYAAPVSAAWLTVVGAATYQHFVVRRQLQRSESARSRYQQAIHFVTHEMRTPLTAIQGSSELMGRYQLPEEKSKQLAQMINTESKRLASMIQTFLDVERLGEGELDVKREPFELATMIETCAARVRPLAERKQIGLRAEQIDECALVGDRELMEYAVYNLMNNAVKYSPEETEIVFAVKRQGSDVRVSVRDQGIGMDEAELRSIFKKFYRTARAEASGEAGTGIGLSIVEQIVVHHGGRMEVSSRPGAGSCFTIVLPERVMASADRDG